MKVILLNLNSNRLVSDIVRKCELFVKYVKSLAILLVCVSVMKALNLT